MFKESACICKLLLYLKNNKALNCMTFVRLLCIKFNVYDDFLS